MDRRTLERWLRAIREPAPTPDLAVRLERCVPDSHRQPRWRWTAAMAKYGLLAAAAAVVVSVAIALFTVGPGGANVAFAAVLDPVVQATGEVRAVHMVLRMLTREGEDFWYVNLETRELQPVGVWLEGPLEKGGVRRARVEKADRIYCFDGQQSVLYFRRQKEAYKGIALDSRVFWPAEWVRRLQQLPPERVEVLAHDEKDGEGRLLLRAKGVPMAPLEPAFFHQFDRETEIVWDLETHRLKGVRRWVHHMGQRVLFSELASIEYRPGFDDALFRLDLPADVRWAGIPETPLPSEHQGLGPRGIATQLFEAAARGDRAVLELYLTSPSQVDWVSGLVTEITTIGEPFRAGDYPGVFVPYEIRVKGGPSGERTIKHQLALRNDNPEHRWVVDGGLP